jgi:hypothetical protein
MKLFIYLLCFYYFFIFDVVTYLTVGGVVLKEGKNLKLTIS